MTPPPSIAKSAPAPAVVRAALDAQPRIALAHLPTPLEPMTIDGREIFIKRDDCTGFALGGNKSRKLEHTMADAMARGATVLLTASGLQSNHVRQCAAAAARCGLGFHAVVAPALDRMPRAHAESGNVLIDSIYGAVLHVVDDEADADAGMARVAAELRAAGETPYIVPLGASDGIGSLGYARAAFELLDQCRAMGRELGHVVVPTGSGGTHGGMLAGLRGAGSAATCWGISVSEPAAAKIAKVRASIDGVEAVLGLGPLGIGPEDIRVDDRHTGGGYAQPSAAANAWLLRLARETGLLLDPVYTAKAFAGLATLAAEGCFTGDGAVVFLHTGGTPALFADPAGLVDPRGLSPSLARLDGRLV